ncbi:ALP1-like protein isoform X1 [Tanacetum coccineum]
MKIPRRKEYIERLAYESDETCLQQLRMNRSTFVKLCGMLEMNGKLKASKYLRVDEQVAMFLYILAHHVKNRVKPEPIPENSTDDRWKWFKGCLRALDGTHISVHVREEDKPRYRNRKGEISTNVIAACTPEMQFTYVLPGWEGSAADGRILCSVMIRENGLKVNKGMESQIDTERGPGKNKRKWNDVEDEKLVEAMVDVLNSGSHFKSDNGFKHGS